MARTFTLSDGTTTVNLLDTTGFQATSLGAKSLSVDANVPAGHLRYIETYSFLVYSSDQDSAATQLQTLHELLRKAHLYQTTSWQNQPVYLTAQTTGETNARYAMVYGTPSITTPDVFAIPFETSNLLEGYSITVIRGVWRSGIPGATPTAATLSKTSAPNDAAVMPVSNYFDDIDLTDIYNMGPASTDFTTDLTGAQAVALYGADYDTDYKLYIGSSDGPFHNVCFTLDQARVGGDEVITTFTTDAWVAFTTNMGLGAQSKSSDLLTTTNGLSGFRGISVRSGLDAAYTSRAWTQTAINSQTCNWLSLEPSEGRASSDNLLSNPGFETAGGGTDVWADWTEIFADGAIANETTIVHAGTDAAKITAGASVNTYVFQAITVTPETNYILRFWTRGDGTYGGRYRIRDVTGAADIVAQAATGVTGAAYVEFLKEFTTPAGCVSVAIYLYCPGTNTGIVYFDATNAVAVETNTSSDGMYVQNKPYIELSSDILKGDIPPMVNLRLWNAGQHPANASSDARAWNVSKVIVGAKTNYTGFDSHLNASGGGLPADWAVSYDTDTTGNAESSNADPNTPGGYYAECTFAATAQKTRVTFVGADLMDAYRGEYKAFLRAEQVGGTDGNISVALQIRMGSTDAGMPARLGELVDLSTHDKGYEIIDLGQFSIPFHETADTDFKNMDIVFEIQAVQNAPSTQLRMADLILIPVDEWSVVLDDPISDNNLGNSSMWGNQYLEYDSGVLGHKAGKYHLEAGTANSFPAENWFYGGKPFSVEPGNITRIYFLMGHYHPDLGWGVEPLVSDPSSLLAVELRTQALYLSLRGAD